ncbi:hypothetical protein A3Q56_06795 [Intoshia linei]|uniref:Uncharacterized protein n=1 Tax=Intoshia linei TaxID=1819745 RepID=A0A177AU06_9BILA|nr:hypothetical protein A3Q56_06795 [Intoshia linei]
MLIIESNKKINIIDGIIVSTEEKKNVYSYFADMPFTNKTLNNSKNNGYLIRDLAVFLNFSLIQQNNIKLIKEVESVNKSEKSERGTYNFSNNFSLNAQMSVNIPYGISLNTIKKAILHEIEMIHKGIDIHSYTFSRF